MLWTSSEPRGASTAPSPGTLWRRSVAGFPLVQKGKVNDVPRGRRGFRLVAGAVREG